jgi:thiol-disulfide isomerase/thioredoxin/YHS domain-containing protein
MAVGALSGSSERFCDVSHVALDQRNGIGVSGKEQQMAHGSNAGMAGHFPALFRLPGAGRLPAVARVALLGLAAVCLATADPLAAGEGWQHDFAAAEAQAKAAQVPLVIHFHASWCGPCRRMESEVLGTSQVRSLLGSGIIGVKVDSDRNRDLVSRFGVTALPTDVIISPDGKVLAKDVGSPGLTGYVSRLRQHMGAAAGSAVAQADPANDSGKPAAAAPETPAQPVPAEEKSAEEPVAAPAQEPAIAESPAAEPRDAVKLINRRNGTRVGLGGFSPVAYSESQSWIEGSSDFAFTYQGVEYLLRSAAERDQFKATPEKFAPALHGCDPVLLTRDRTVQVGVIGLRAEHDSRTYFFATRETRDEFLREPTRFSTPRSLVFFQPEERRNPS